MRSTPSAVVVRVLAAAIALLLGAQFTTLFLVPPSDGHLAEADAVVVLSGDHGDRLTLGLRLVEGGIAPTLVILNPGDGPSARSRPLCDQPQAFEVRCPTPALISTIGDVREIRAQAAREGWRQVIVVTSTFHVSRSRLLLARCSDLDVDVRGSPVQFSGRLRARAVAHEVGGMAQSLLLLEC